MARGTPHDEDRGGIAARRAQAAAPNAWPSRSRVLNAGADMRCALARAAKLWRAWLEELGRRIRSGPELMAALEHSSTRSSDRADYGDRTEARPTRRGRLRLRMRR